MAWEGYTQRRCKRNNFNENVLFSRDNGWNFGEGQGVIEEKAATFQAAAAICWQLSSVVESCCATPRKKRSSCGYDQTDFTPGPINMAGFAPFLGINFCARPLSTSAV